MAFYRSVAQNGGESFPPEDTILFVGYNSVNSGGTYSLLIPISDLQTGVVLKGDGSQWSEFTGFLIFSPKILDGKKFRMERRISSATVNNQKSFAVSENGASSNTVIEFGGGSSGSYYYSDFRMSNVQNYVMGHIHFTASERVTLKLV